MFHKHVLLYPRRPCDFLVCKTINPILQNAQDLPKHGCRHFTHIGDEEVIIPVVPSETQKLDTRVTQDRLSTAEESPSRSTHNSRHLRNVTYLEIKVWEAGARLGYVIAI